MEFLNNISPREYQERIFEVCRQKNCLVVLPTGLGKTLIALMLTIERMKKFSGEKVVFLAPTRPLAEQHLRYFKKNLPELFGEMELFTGKVDSENRKKIWQTADIIFSTPQCVANDLRKNFYNLKEVCLLIEDEAHRCLKNYDYNYIAKEYMKQAKNPRILGLTASPGSEKSQIKEICKNLSVEEVELRTRDSEDVKPYLQELKFEKVFVDFPSEFEELRVVLKKIYENYVEELKSRNVLYGPVNKITLIELQKKIFRGLSMNNKNFNYMLAASSCAQAIKIQHSLELLETQTLLGFQKYLKKLISEAEQQKSKGVQKLVKKPEFNFIFQRTGELLEKGYEHPKLSKLIEIIEFEKSKNKNIRIIVFTQFRETASIIAQKLKEIKIKSRVFVGQAKKTSETGEITGLNQKEQQKIISEFSTGEINVLVATSVHPDEYIILKKANKIMIKKIGEFGDSFITADSNKTISKKINGWKALTTNGKKIFFKPITYVHKHPIQSNLIKLKLSSGFDCLVTENHSLFSFNEKENFIPSIPQQNKFVALSLKCPDYRDNNKIDAIKEIYENTPKEEIKDIFGNLDGLTQAKIRILKTNYQVLSQIKRGELNISKLSKLIKRDYSTISDCLARLKKEGFVEQKRKSKNYQNISKITSRGREYLEFLDWFLNNVRYKKGKYKFNLTKFPKKEFNNFFEQNINVNYGKTRFPRFIELNESLARFLGFYVSEGSARKTKSTSDVFLAAQDKEMQKMMEESVENGLKLKTRKNQRGIAIDSQIAYHLIKSVFKAGIGAYNKEVPEIIFTSSDNIKWEFLKAYFLGDGYLGKDRMVLTTVSRKLITGLVLLLRMLGINKITLQQQKHIYRLIIQESLPFAKIKEKNEKRGHAYYSLIPEALSSKKVFEKYENFYSPSTSHLKCRKNGKWKTDTCFDYIKNIEKIKNPKFVYDLSVKDTEKFIGGTGLFCLHNSIGEEGLDIPEVNEVIFYEPIPSAIRKIQRAGRTARLMKGKLIILITKNTRDEAYFWAAHHKEKRMYSAINSIKEDMKNEKNGITTEIKKIERTSAKINKIEKQKRLF